MDIASPEICALRSALDVYLNAYAHETLGGSGSPGNAIPLTCFDIATPANRQTDFENLFNIRIGVDAIPSNMGQTTITLSIVTHSPPLAIWARHLAGV